MTREDKAMLLLDKQEAEADVAKLRQTLNKIGQQFCRLGQELHSHPETVIFDGAPSGLQRPPDVLLATNHPRYDWATVGDATEMIRAVQKLRDVQERLRQIDRELDRSVITMAKLSSG